MQAEATSGYAAHSLLATVNVLRSIIAAAAQPPLAKVADVFGRVELILLAIFFVSAFAQLRRSPLTDFL